MSGIMLTQYSGAILGPIARVLGVILNAVFNIVPNVGVAIIIFTVIIYICLLPLTYKQQKFSKLSAKMNPEIQKVQAKYKGKNDQASMQRQNEEIQAIYGKYGVSPTGSCLQLFIQMPILFALYRVINSVPAYVTKIYSDLSVLANEILSTDTGVSVISGLDTTKRSFAKYTFTGDNAVSSVIDVLNRASSKEWDAIGAIPGINTDVYEKIRATFEGYNSFLGLNISNTPMFLISEALKTGAWLLLVGAVMIPVLAAATQWINTLFMPQPTGDGNGSAAGMMKSMNVTMPLVSAFFCLSLPCGMGIYWIAGAVIRSIEQVIINKQIDKMDIDSLIEKNAEKYNKKMEGRKSIADSISNSSIASKSKMTSNADKDAAMAKAEEYYNNHAKPGSIASKANMVKKYNDTNKK